MSDDDEMHGYMRLPVGADGKPLAPRETVYEVNGDGTRYVVAGYQFNDGEVTVYAREDGLFTHTAFEPDELTHHEPDSWERLRLDLADMFWHSNGPTERQALELAERATKLAGESCACDRDKVLAVVGDMERLIRGHDVPENAPVRHWARELHQACGEVAD